MLRFSGAITPRADRCSPSFPASYGVAAMTRPNHIILLAIVICAFAGVLASAQTVAAQSATVTKNAPIYLQPNPPTSLPPLRVAAVGTTLKVIGGEEGWLQVEFEDPQFGRRVGWVRSEFVTVRRPELEPMDLSVRPQQAAPGQTSSRPTATSLERQPQPIDQGQFLQAGVVEVEALGSLTAVTVSGETVTTGLFLGSLGVMATRVVEVGASTAIEKVGDIGTVGSFGGFASFHVPVHGSVAPFLGVGVGSSWATGVSDHPVSLQVFGGFKAFMPGGGAAFVVRPFYQHDFWPGDGASGVNYFGVGFGMSVFVGGSR